MSCNKEMVKVINSLNELQNKMLSLGVTKLFKKLPQIVVIGSQSAGKSSVLESFVGRDFLPRGGDIVTRRPLILQLKQNKKDEQVFAKFSHLKEVFTDFNEIRLEIQRETDRIAPGFAISSKPITLMVKSPDVLDLNLIDLPGMTKVPVKGQPEDIETKVRDLILEYITNENCIILAVTPANQDLSTSDAIKLAREVDPEGKRTIGVLTKLDIMDKGTNALNILLNRHQIQLKKGFIGVINRSPEDILLNKEMREAIEKEKAFFSEHPAYKRIRDKLGIEYLQKYLQKELCEHLFAELPPLYKDLKKNLIELNEKIEVLSFTINEMKETDMILNTIRKFKQNFSDEIGTGNDVPVDRENKGTQINVEVNIRYAEEIETIPRDQNQLKDDITRAIKNIYGVKNEVFTPSKAFSIVTRKQIELMRKPSLDCIESVCIELESIVRSSAKGIGKFPKLIDKYASVTLEYLDGCKTKVIDMVNHTIDLEMDYMSPNHMELIRKEVEKSSKIKTLGSTRRPDKNGWINYQTIDYFFCIEYRTLKWYPDSNQSTVRGQMSLIGAGTFQQDKRIILQTNKTQLELKFDTQQNALWWGKAFLDNAYDDSANNEMAEDTVAGNVKYAMSLDTQVETVRRLVMAYVKITEQTLKDRMPKLCQKELIDALELFVGETLSIRFRKKDYSIDDLVDMTPLKEEIQELKAQRSLYKDAVQAMSEVMNSSIIDN